jgi:hypothetical protein
LNRKGKRLSNETHYNKNILVFLVWVSGYDFGYDPCFGFRFCGDCDLVAEKNCSLVCIYLDFLPHICGNAVTVTVLAAAGAGCPCYALSFRSNVFATGTTLRFALFCIPPIGSTVLCFALVGTALFAVLSEFGP